MTTILSSHPLSTSMLVTFIAYIISMLLVGIGASYFTKDLDDYILGGRNLSPFVSALSAGASDMSGWLMMGLPGIVYVVGLSQAWIAVGLLLGAYSNWQFVAKRLRIYTEKLNNSLTIPVYLKNRFEDTNNVLPRLSSLMILFFFTIYTAAGFHACTILFESMFGLTYDVALLLSFFSIVSYVLIGGFIGVCWTDTLQGILVFLALIFLPMAAFIFMRSEHIHFAELFAQARPKSFFQPFHEHSILTLLSLLGWGLGYFGQPHILVRFMAIRSANELKTARNIGMIWMFLSLLGAILVGILAVPYFIHHPLKNPESVFIALSQALFPEILAGLLLAALLSAIMSSASSQLIILSSVTAEDFYRPLRGSKASQKELLWAGRASVAILSAVSLLLAHKQDATVLSVVAYAWSGLGSTFGPVILFSLFWRRMTRLSAILALPAGGIVVVIWQNLSSYGGLFKLYSIIPGFLTASLAIVLISLLDKKGPSNTMKTTFDAVQELSNRVV